VIPHGFEYVAPSSVEDCVAALTDGGRVLAGGTWVLPELSRSESRPSRLVDLRRAGLRGITAVPGGLSLGPMTTYADLLASPLVAEHVPMLVTMAGGITGGWALRSQATVGGSLMSARPSSDVPGALVAGGALARVAGPDGERVVPVAELLTGAMRTSLSPGELLIGLELPATTGGGTGYVKIKRGGSSWPIATAAAVLRCDDAGVCTSAVLVLGGVSATPVRVDAAAVLVGRVPDAAALAEAAARAAAAVTDPYDDVLAPGSYRAAVAGPVARRALTQAARTAAADLEEAA
jgi:carbon-monoxide dehydrogenase medium subunit